MSKELSRELQAKIEQEAKSDSSAYGYFPGSEEDEDLQSVYRFAAGKYALELQEAQGKADRYEKALKDIRRWELATGKKIRVKHLDILKDIMRVVNKALTPKQTTDDTSNG